MVPLPLYKKHYTLEKAYRSSGDRSSQATASHHAPVDCRQLSGSMATSCSFGLTNAASQGRASIELALTLLQLRAVFLARTMTSRPPRLRKLARHSACRTLSAVLAKRQRSYLSLAPKTPCRHRTLNSTGFWQCTLDPFCSARQDCTLILLVLRN